MKHDKNCFRLSESDRFSYDEFKFLNARILFLLSYNDIKQ